MRRLVILSLLPVAALMGCSPSAPPALHGYIEGEYLYLAPSSSGYLVQLGVRRGDTAAAGQLAFTLDDQLEQQAVQEAQARGQASSAREANLRQAQRQQEQAALAAQLAAAEAQLKLSTSQWRQQEALYQQRLIAQAVLDVARANVEHDQGRVDELKQRLNQASTSVGRVAEIAAARAETSAALAQLQQRQRLLARRQVVVPATGLIADTFVRPGEWVNAGQPVLSLLPPANRKIRFYVPEPQRARLQLGQVIAVSCDGCPAGLSARIRFIADQAEYTPPVLYSEDSRAKLVYRVEAQPANAATLALHPGQPVDIQFGNGT